MRFLRVTFILLIFTELLSVVACKREMGNLELVHVELSVSKDIISVSDSLIIPFQYTGKIWLDSLSIQERKEKFIDLLLPTILVSKYKLEQKTEKFLAIIKEDTSKWKKSERIFIDNLFREYKTIDTAELQSRLLTHPTSIVLAQAAIESAWGTSRFYKEANNPFGIWSFNKDEPRIPSKLARDGEFVYLRKYNNLQESIDDYFKVIARGPYVQFRKARKKTNNPDVLVHNLINYSEKKTVYTRELSIIIKKNNLLRFDHFKIHPDYIK